MILIRISPDNYRNQKINANLFWTKFPYRESWTSAPKSVFSYGPSDGEKLSDPWASGRKGQECPQEIPTKKFMLFSSLKLECK